MFRGEVPFSRQACVRTKPQSLSKQEGVRGCVWISGAYFPKRALKFSIDQELERGGQSIARGENVVS